MSPLPFCGEPQAELPEATQDQVADPKFAALGDDASAPADLRLLAGSPAIDAGRPTPESWPDPLREVDGGEPDIGVLPQGVEPWGVGIDGRMSLFGGMREAP